MTIEEYIDLISDRIQPIPRDIVAAAPFDSYVTDKQMQGYLDTQLHKPWAGSGHYGKEMGLLEAGYKRMALVYYEEMPLWLDAIDRNCLAVRECDGHVLVSWPEEADIMELVDTYEKDGGIGTGLALGYHMGDVAAFLRNCADYLEHHQQEK